MFRILFIALALLGTAAHAASTGDYPRKSIRVLVGIPPGGGIDTVARAIGQVLSERWGQGVIVDNRTGAGGAIAMEVASQAAPDGHTLLGGSTGTVATATLLKKVAFDTRRAYAPIVQMYTQPYVLAAEPSLPLRSVRDLIAYAKAKPNGLNYASTGIGSASHLGMEFFKSMAGIELVHVPYRGLGPAMVDVISGQIQLVFGAAIIVTPNVRTGRLRALATGGTKRSMAYADIPTVAESGLPGFEWSNSYALFAPAAVPDGIVAKLNREISLIALLPEVQKKLAADGVEPAASNTPAECRVMFEREFARLEKFFRTSGIKP